MTLDEIEPGMRVFGLVPGEAVTVRAVETYGDTAASVMYQLRSGAFGERVVYDHEVDSLEVATVGGRPFDADAADFKLAAEASRIRLAGLHDPMLAVATSDVQPLPHQIRAVYGELLPRTPLRFLLADDPGAGKTVMAGLYLKELMLRDDVNRCLIVAPGGLVEQWQDELFFKFGVRFELLTAQLMDANVAGSVFDRHPLLIARMDQLARNDDLLSDLRESEWDLVVVDEAHRMGVHWFGGKLNKTKRFELGEMLGQVTRHLLLMTATPHAGKEEDFQAFLTLLDRDEFAGRFRKGVHDGDAGGRMRRMVKEDLLTFEGKPLFPERIAETVPYELSPLETELYQEVTEYVREGMNRAERLDDKRRNTVGFALTVLQRRLASSPAAIHQSLVRRDARLRQRRRDIADGVFAEQASGRAGAESFDEDELSAEEFEELEEQVMDAATAARTVEELDVELAELSVLIELAARVRRSGEDRKWTELRDILERDSLQMPDGSARKLIIFTEHRDTLTYLSDRIRTLIGRHEAVEEIHGGVRREERRRITAEFTNNPDCRILLATDAAGEGLNLQAAHLMVNYDLPWNPNRIEQRFGRIHRIGQSEVCRLWNLVATNTREGDVFTRLLEKIEEQREAYGGKVFDVIGAAFDETPLRSLLMEAIRYGEQPEVRARMHEVIDSSVSDGLAEVLEQHALAKEQMPEADLEEMRRLMDEARARRLQPHYIAMAFREAFSRLGGRMARRERDRFEITNVPAAIRRGRSPIASRYERVTFDIRGIDHADSVRAELLAPGHPLHDGVMDAAVDHWGGALERGSVLVSPDLEEPRLLVGVLQEIVDGTGDRVSRRFGYAFVDPQGVAVDAGPAPYLDFAALPEGGASARARGLWWLPQAESRALGWVISHQLPALAAEVQPRRAQEIERTRERVSTRLGLEVNRLAGEAMAAVQREAAGEKTKESAESLNRKALELSDRMDRRLEELDRQALMSASPPRIVSAALVVPLSWAEAELSPDAPVHAVETKEVERRGVDLVLATERQLGRVPEEQAFNNPGFDVLSETPGEDPIRIEVKARIAGADDFFVTHNEVMTGKNAAPRYRLALVRVDPRGEDFDEVRYLDDPFANIVMGDFDAMGVRGDWNRMWDRGRKPF